MSLLTDKIKELISVEASNAPFKHERGNKKACTISICSQKGGVGKTTTAVNLGSALAKSFNKKVLICDLDPQGHVEKSIGSIIPEGLEYSPLSAILTNKKGNILDSVVQTELENLSITPGDKNLYETESLLATKIGKEFILQEAIKLARTHYDIILFDCPPNLGNLTLNALVASDYCLVPCEMSVLSFEGVNDLIETLETVNERLNKKLKLLGVLMTRVDVRNIAMNRVVEENLKNYFKGKTFKTQININTALNKAQLEGRPIFDYAPSSSGSINYQSLADEFMKKLKKLTHLSASGNGNGNSVAHAVSA
jgi:chromosome partitioning protein